ncbi:MAG: triose-phosphate isomerase [Firmicutes bacterium]|nr:triose-phosphate isomerase [Bacillota bacterium]
MKQIFVNLKRFDIPRLKGGVCNADNSADWIRDIMLKSRDIKGVGLIYLLPEALLLSAMEKKPQNVEIGCQSVYRQDIAKGGNFGAFTSQLPATAAAHYGCTWAMIGHSEERRDKDNESLNEQIKCALGAGLSVLYCVGEKESELARKYEVIKNQLDIGLNGVNGNVAIAYEPIWAIGPGKTPPNAEYIADISSFIKKTVYSQKGYIPNVVYGGGLKEENAREIASVETIDGGLVALTRFMGEIGFYPNELKRIIEKYLEV